MSPKAHFEEPSAEEEYVAEEGFEDYYQDPEAEHGPDDYVEGYDEDPNAPDGLPEEGWEEDAQDVGGMEPEADSKWYPDEGEGQPFC